MLPGPALASVLQVTTINSLRVARDHDAIVVGGGAASGCRDAAVGSGPARARARCRRSSGPVAGAGAAARRRPGATPCDAARTTLDTGKANSQGARGSPPTRAMASTNSIALLCLGARPENYVDDRDCPYVTAPGHPFVDPIADVGWTRRRSRSWPAVLPAWPGRFHAARRAQSRAGRCGPAS